MLNEKSQKIEIEKRGRSKKNQPTKFGFTWELPFPLRGLSECLKIILL